MSVTERFRNQLFKNKRFYHDFYSIDSGTTNQTSEENFKKKKSKDRIVSFNSVEIIEVESYKEYNKLDNPIELEEFERKYTKRCDECYCILI